MVNTHKGVNGGNEVDNIVAFEPEGRGFEPSNGWSTSPLGSHLLARGSLPESDVHYRSNKKKFEEIKKMSWFIFESPKIVDRPGSQFSG